MGANPESKASVHVIQDQAVFHLKAQDEWLPENVRQLALPPYSPELNPMELVGVLQRETECSAASIAFTAWQTW